jgi:hypothetical protein
MPGIEIPRKQTNTEAIQKLQLAISDLVIFTGQASSTEQLFFL